MTAVDEGVLSVEPPPRERQFDGRWLTNTDPVLRKCWHPVSAAAEVGETPMQITLLRRADRAVICLLDSVVDAIGVISSLISRY
jgi:hypothetical protein